MNAHPRMTEAQIARAIKAVQRSGVTIGEIVVTAGEVRILAVGQTHAVTSLDGEEASCDEIFGIEAER